jgi:hypothetical protein
MYNENFMGINGFFWFTGLVEDRQDPLKAGRVKVRIVGSHTADKIKLPTSELPWCLVMLPVTASGVSGIGQSATGLLEGSWVFGFFRDGSFKQEPVILGSLPGRPTQGANSSQGFFDPNGVYPKYINEPDVNRLAVNGEIKHPSLATDAANRITSIQAYNSAWEQPNSSYAAVYPFNHVYESESGHIVEFDDTKDHERIHIRHRSGTSIELRPNGDQLTVIRGNSYLIIDQDNKVYIQGNSDVTVQGNANVKAGSDANVLAQNINMITTGDLNMNIGGKLNITAGSLTENIAGETNLTYEGDLHTNIKADTYTNKAAGGTDYTSTAPRESGTITE